MRRIRPLLRYVPVSALVLALTFVVCRPAQAQRSERRDLRASQSAGGEHLALATTSERTAVGTTPLAEHDGRAVDAAPTTILANSNTPRITADGRVMFFNSTIYGNRPWARRRVGKTDDYDSDIYYVIKKVMPDGTEVWGEPVNLGPSINTGEDDAVEAINPSGGTIFFSSLAPGWVRNGGPFYRADLIGAEWKNITGFGGGITEFFLTANRYKIYGSAVNADGDAFYFATTAHSESGEHQIWMSRFRDGIWQYPENLGTGINAMGGSFAPFIAADGRTLYFSSGRGGGFGGDDIYMTSMKDSSWQAPVNLGPSVNSTSNESFFSIPAGGDRVYLSKSDAATRHTSIVDATLKPQYLPDGIVLLTGRVVDHASCEGVQAQVTIEDLGTNQMTHRTLGLGVESRFVVVLRPGHDYGISVSAPGYAFLSMRYTIPEETNYRSVVREIELERVKQGSTFALNNIFFDYDADSLRPESRPELDRLLSLMQQYPTMRIQIGGHTDNVGSPRYNDDLSQRRADAVRRYIVEHGSVDAGRIRTRGYGARQPAASNASDEGRQRNRIVDVAVVGM